MVTSLALAAPAVTVRIPLPSPGDASYGVVQVQAGKHLKAARQKGDRVLGQTIGGLKFDVRTKGWKKLRKDTKVYIVTGPAGQTAPGVSDVALFITRPLGAKGPKAGKVSFTIKNAIAVKKSFWVKKIDKRGVAKIFAVRNIVSTAVANWTRYLVVLKLARALSAAHHAVDLHGRFTQRAAATGTISVGGTKMSPLVQQMFNLVFGTINDPLAYQSAKKSPIVPAFITTELKNPTLAAKWRDVAGKLPAAIPDKYAAAAATEAQFAHNAAPRISRAKVVIADVTNSSQQAAIESPRLASDQIPGQSITVQKSGTGTGVVYTDDKAISCGLVCSHFFTSGETVHLSIYPNTDSRIDDLQGCTGGVSGTGRTCRVDITATTTAPALTVRVTFAKKDTGGGGGGPPAAPATDLDGTFGTAGVTLTTVTHMSNQVSAWANAVAARTGSAKMVVAGGREQFGNANAHDWVIARYSKDGTPDGTFGTNGVQAFVEGAPSDGATALVVDSSDNIFFTGDHAGGGNSPVEVYEEDASGNATSFGGAGIGLIPITGSTETYATDLALQPDGKVLVAGHATILGNHKVFVARFNTNGTPDTTFNNGASAYVQIPDAACDSAAPTCWSSKLAISTDPNTSNVVAIYVAGYSNGFDVGGRAWKLVPGSGQNNWALDATYGGHGGAAWLDPAKMVYPYAALLTDGGFSLVLGGEVSHADNQCAIAALDVHGALSSSFGTGGVAEADHAHGCSIRGMARQGGGAFVFVGNTTSNAHPTEGVIGRFTSPGTADVDYVSNGVATANVGGASPAFFNALLLQGDKPVAVGGAGGPPHQMLLARYRGAP